MKNFQIFHVTCKGLIFYKNRFLLYRANDPRFFGALDCPGGRVDNGELLEEVLKRELLEEAGLNLDKIEHNLQLLCLNQTSEVAYGYDDKTQLIEIYYKITIPDNINLELKALEEVSTFEWINKDTDLEKYKYIIKSRKDVYKKAQKLLK
jgi:8-oxo-dGTP pyrophosphatase MutT (NUDIX family)